MSAKEALLGYDVSRFISTKRGETMWLCPRCGVVLKPSRLIVHPDWYECPKCARLIGAPDLNDENDLGVILEPGKDYDPDPNRRVGMIQAALKKRSSGSKKRSRSKKPDYRPIFPLPIPPVGARLTRNGTASEGS